MDSTGFESKTEALITQNVDTNQPDFVPKFE